MRKIFFYVSLFFLGACSHSVSDIDVSGIKVDVQIKRLDKDLFAFDMQQPDNSLRQLKQKYTGFFNPYSAYIIRIGNIDEPGGLIRLQTFMNDYSVNRLKSATDSVFSDISWLNHDLSQALKHYRYYFPQKCIPAIYTYIGGLNQSVVVDSCMLGIGLDKYLGSDCGFYSGMYNYERKRMQKENIVPDCMQAIAMSEWAFNDSVDHVLANIIYEGRLVYFNKRMIPGIPDTLLWNFTAKQLDFCARNERHMWVKLVENKLLFKTDRLTIVKFTNDGPYTREFGNESPARAAVWLGYRIVCSYMENNSDVSLEQLMNMRDYQQILSLSEYEP